MWRSKAPSPRRWIIRPRGRRGGIGRPSLVGDFRKFVVDLVEEEPTLKSVEVFRRAGLAGYAGRKSALYALIASVRPRDVVPLVRFEGVPGEFSQHDFGEVDVEYLDGTPLLRNNCAPGKSRPSL